MLSLPPKLVRDIEASPIPVSVADPTRPDLPLVLVNQAFLTLTGYERDEVIGRNCRFLQGPDTDQTVRRQIAAALVNGDRIICTIRNYDKAGRPFDNFLIIRMLRGGDQSRLCAIGCQFVVHRALEAYRLRQHLGREAAIYEQLARAMETASQMVQDSQMLSAEALFSCAVQHIRRAEAQAVLTLRR